MASEITNGMIRGPGFVRRNHRQPAALKPVVMLAPELLAEEDGDGISN
jgi:hypothetical protein